LKESKNNKYRKEGKKMKTLHFTATGKNTLGRIMSMVCILIMLMTLLSFQTAWGGESTDDKHRIRSQTSIRGTVTTVNTFGQLTRR
jgi:hypothetical protein